MIDQMVVALYLFGVLGLGLWAGRGMRTVRDFSVVGQQYSGWVVFATLAASFIGGGFSSGNAAKVFAFGIASSVALWGFSLKELLIARYIAPKSGPYRDCISVGGIMGRQYGKASQVITGILGVIVCAGITGAQVGAMGAVFHTFLGTSRILGILIGCGIVIAYSSVGGMRAVVLTDIVQFILLSVGMPLALWLGIRQVGGLAALRDAVPVGHLQLFNDHMTPLALASLFLSFMLGETLVPPYTQRLLIGRDIRATARGSLFAGLFSIPFFAITGALGLVALAIRPDLDSNQALPFVVNTLLPIGLRGFVIAGVISIVMSSADSFLNAAAVSLVSDVINPLRARALSDRTGLRIMKLTSLLVGIGAVGFALKIDNVLDILLFAYNFWAPVVLVPLLAIFLGIGARPGTFFASALGGVAGLSVWHWMLKDPFGVVGLVVGVLTNLIVFVVAHRINRPARAA
ncbi:MAG: sodium:solute symporter family protein [Kiritimatiellia bacterium]|nr:sodium:solute symporter family protein [Kiritimatiellia bacterium]